MRQWKNCIILCPSNLDCWKYKWPSYDKWLNTSFSSFFLLEAPWKNKSNDPKIRFQVKIPNPFSRIPPSINGHFPEFIYPSLLPFEKPFTSYFLCFFSRFPAGNLLWFHFNFLQWNYLRNSIIKNYLIFNLTRENWNKTIIGFLRELC